MEEKKNKKRGLIGTILFHAALLILFALYGLTTPVPIPQQGISLNFGTTDLGSGDTPAESTNPQPTEPVKEESNPTPVEPVVEEEVLTQETAEAIEVPTENSENPKQDPVEEVEKEPELDERLKKTLNNPFNKGNQNSSEGNDNNQIGDKGKANGTLDGKSYDGGAGGSGNSYSLSGRDALKKIKPNYNCQESGKVVVVIKVDPMGNTIDAKLELKGTTNTASCLTNRAIEAALKTKWQAKPDAPAEQFGRIVYSFELN